MPDCVPASIRHNHLYVGDHLIRHYQPLGLAAYLRDTGQPDTIQEAEIIGGIGRLVLRADGNDTWEPTITNRVDAPESVISKRTETCAACTSFVDGRCSIAGCGCSGFGHVRSKYSKCPTGKWKE
jgi:hypothetical protein